MGLPDKQPSVALAVIQEAAREGDGVLLTEGRCVNTLLGILETRVRVQDFAEKIVAELRPGLFYEQQRSSNGRFSYDAYGIVISDELAQTFGLEERRSFYVGLQLKESRSGGRVIVVTLHPPTWDMHCIGGAVVPGEEQDDD